MVRLRGPVLVAMSGGVDSSIAAALLIEQGHEVVGVTMKLWGGDSDSGCCSVADVDDARRAADRLGIEHHVFNFGDEFDEYVVDPYIEDHRRGVTPNPCVECNRHLKFARLFDRARALGFERVATGHHARIVEAQGRRWVARGADPAKDQSYVLHMLNQDQLARTELPIGHLTKDLVRDEARRLGLPTADKPDSQDVCFITSMAGREAFLGSRIPLHSGVAVDLEGHTVGEVPAIELVTIGQRKGLGVSGIDGPRYAVAVDAEAAVVTVGQADDLLCDQLALGPVSWADTAFEGDVLVQVSAHGTPRSATYTGGIVRWHQPERRVAPGQSVVLYADDRVLGGAPAA
ncbi:MAG: tRNA 2-thiouridine(34) synthase MnmA [Actinomycetia bacterium]|nr:tRNA 2-thiouridine(34) synthase MnmA [Actinomycetes bacterium]